MTSFAPIDQIHQSLQAFHVPASDRRTAVPSVHYCACPGDGRPLQCLIYDSDRSDAKLLGIEYMVDEDTFRSLPAEEKSYWHSHVHEVASGTLVCTGLRGVVGSAAHAARAVADAVGASNTQGGEVPDAAEDAVMQRIYRLYGKIIHTWHPPQSDLPLGPPTLMMSTTERHPGPDGDHIERRDKEMRIDTHSKRTHRKHVLDPEYRPADGADAYEHDRVVPRFHATLEPFVTEDGSWSKQNDGR